MLHNFVEQAVKSLEEEKARLVDALANGNVRSMEEYNYITGQFRGLEASVYMLRERLQAYTED